MRRILSLLALTVTSLFLFTCSNHESRDRKDYWISENRAEIILTIKGDTDTIDSEGESNVPIDTENQTFKIEGFSALSVPDEYKDGVLTANLI